MQQFSAANVTLGVLSAAVVVGSLSVWGWVLARWRAGKAAVPFEARRPIPWGPADAALLLAFWFIHAALLSLLFQCLFVGEFSSAAIRRIDPRVATLGMAATDVWSCIVGCAWLALRGATLADLGFVGGRMGRDLGLGAAAFLAAVVPVFAVQFVLTHFWSSEHPVVSLLSNNPGLGTIVLVVVSAAIIAPLGEEFLFRLVLQGAIEGSEWRALLAAGHARSADQPAIHETQGGETASPSVATNTDRAPTNPYQAPLAAADSRPERARDDANPLAWAMPRAKIWGLPAGVWPMTISATVFAAIHAGHGPDPIALLLLALVMGYLYRQTHRLLACIVLHMLLNSFSLTMLWLS